MTRFFKPIPLAIVKFYLTVLTWNVVSNLYYSYEEVMQIMKICFKKRFILFVCTYTVGYIYMHVYIYICIYI